MCQGERDSSSSLMQPGGGPVQHFTRKMCCNGTFSSNARLAAYQLMAVACYVFLSCMSWQYQCTLDEEGVTAGQHSRLTD